MRVSEGSTVSHGPSRGMSGPLVRVTVRSRQVTSMALARNGLIAGRYLILRIWQDCQELRRQQAEVSDLVQRLRAKLRDLLEQIQM